MAFSAPDKNDDDQGDHDEKEVVEPPGDSSNTIPEKESTPGSPKHFKKSSTCSSSSSVAIDDTNCKDQINLDVLEKKNNNNNGLAAERSQWVLNAPEPPGLWQELVDSVKETISSCGNKYSSLMNQSLTKRVVSVHQQIFPILVWGRNYKATMFKHDLMAGLTIASLCIPQVNYLISHVLKFFFFSKVLTVVCFQWQSIGYATLAKLEPQYGLCKS